MTDTQHPEGWDALAEITRIVSEARKRLDADRPDAPCHPVSGLLLGVFCHLGEVEDALSASPAPQREAGRFRSACAFGEPESGEGPTASPSGRAPSHELQAEFKFLRDLYKFFHECWIGTGESYEDGTASNDYREWRDRTYDRWRAIGETLSSEQTGGDPSAATTPANSQDEPKTTPPTTSGKGA